MKTFIGNGVGGASTAVEAATSGLYLPTFILFYAPYEKLEEAAVEIRKKYPDVPSMGCIGTKIVNGTSNDNGIVVVGFFDDARIQADVITEISTCSIAYVSRIMEKVQQIKAGTDDTLCLEFCTGNEEVLITTFTSCLNGTGIHLAGGTMFGVPEGKNSIVAFNGRVYEDACVFALIKNNTGRIKVFKENIYKKGPNAKPHYATDVDTASKTLKTLDDRIAADVYSTELNVPRNKIIGNVFLNPMGRVVGDEVFIASMKDLLPGGSITNYKRINKNDCIYFLELGDYKEIERATRKEIMDSVQHISLILSVDCIYRYLFYQQEGYFDTYIADMASLGKHVGVVGGGEQINNQHVNQTMVCAVFE